jgi:sialidase-1
MSSIKVLKTGILYRNPLPHVYSRHAYFPSVVQLADGELVAAFSIGQAFEAVDLHGYVSRSVDGGATWTCEGRLVLWKDDRLTSDVCRISRGTEESIEAFVIRHNRSRQEHGLANPDNLGFVEVELLLLRSMDGGRSWSEPAIIEPPLDGPSFEMTSPIVPLRDGSWLLPTSTWRGWEGDCPNGMRAVAFVSTDQGRTWPSYVDVMHDVNQSTIYWESKIAELVDGRLVAAAWAFDEEEGRDLPIHYAIGIRSEEAGRSRFSQPRSTGLQGQTVCLTPLSDGRVLTIYRRTDEPGLWANLSRVEEEQWINETQAPLWGSQLVDELTGNSNDMVHNFTVLKFGAPSLCLLQDGTLLIVFWAVEDGVSVIRWIKVRIDT